MILSFDHLLENETRKHAPDDLPMLALGATYWLLRERDDRTAGESSDDQS